MTEIAQKTGFTKAVVKNYLAADFSPINAHYGKQREGKLEPFREDVLIEVKKQATDYRATPRCFDGEISTHRLIYIICSKYRYFCLNERGKRIREIFHTPYHVRKRSAGDNLYFIPMMSVDIIFVVCKKILFSFECFYDFSCIIR